jgi:hypothetical protein
MSNRLCMFHSDAAIGVFRSSVRCCALGKLECIPRNRCISRQLESFYLQEVYSENRLFLENERFLYRFKNIGLMAR